METASERWLDADRHRHLCTLCRELIANVAHAYLPFGSTLAAGHLADLQEKIDALDAIKAETEPTLAREVDGDPDAWLRDAWGK
jgi:hypothetical protein